MTLPDLRSHIASVTGLSGSDAETVTKSVLKIILRRVEKPIADQVVGELPVEWQPYFSGMGRGFDTTVSSSTVLNDVGKFLNISSDEALKVLPKITLALTAQVPTAVLFEAFSQLPFEMREKLDIGDPRLQIQDLDAHVITPDPPAIGTHSLDPFRRRRVVILHMKDSLFTASQAMIENNVGCVIVSDPYGKLVGILTDRDLAISVSVLPKGLQGRIEEAMTEGLVYASEESSLDDVVTLMIRHGVRRIPIVSNNRCSGLVTLDDLLATESAGLDQIRRIVSHQIVARPHRLSRSKERAAERGRQTALRFRSMLSEALELDPDRAEEAAKIVLRNLLRRVTPPEAIHMLAQLPSLWQPEFRKLPAGPDRSIDSQTVVGDLCNKLDVTEERAVKIYTRVLKTLGELTSEGEIASLRAQLPKDMQMTV